MGTPTMDGRAELRHALLVERNGPRVEYDRDTTLLALIEAQAAAHPDRPAVRYGDEELTYGLLDGKANALAAELRAAGVAHGDLVPLLVGNTTSLPLAMLALMKLGAPFVPVDESWPPARIATILGDLAPSAVVCTPSLADLAGGCGPVVLAEPHALEPAPAPEADRPGPDDLIYGFYTSGSTGMPKCALNLHRGLLNRCLTMSRRFAAEGAVVLQNSRHVFDSSIWQLLWPLSAGALVVIPERHDILDLTETVATIERHGVTMTDFVPSIFNALVEMVATGSIPVESLRSLRRVLIGGEEISPHAVHRFRGLLPGVRITNTYGPTECSIGSVFHEVGDEETIPLGRPIDNTIAIVLDDEGELVAPGEQGEIHIGGDCVGAGYLNDPVKTEAAFVPNPFPEIPGDRLYRTGDLGWVDEQGLLWFVGRRDHQIKLGGVRIELAEVEAMLARHPAVREAKVVVAGEEERRRLVAYFLASAPVTAAELHDHLDALLPVASQPKDIVELPEFPLTPNGKADRRALMALAATEQRDEDAVAPRDETERRIHAIWTQLLDEPDFGVTTNFFHAGGDSLAAHRLSVALRTEFGHAPGVRDIVMHPTVAEQAALIRGDGPSTPPAVGRRLVADAHLPDDVRRLGGEPWAPGPILLTGATGFVGAHLLHELLRATDVPLWCLVRAQDEQAARARLERALEHYELLGECDMARVEVICGDLAAPGLGVDAARYETLARDAAVLVQCGAMVNLLLDYDAHRPANVDGTIEILRLAARGRFKHVHHVSTLGIFPVSAAAGGPVREDIPPLEGALPEEGYVQSKWVAERLALAARGRGIPTSIYRLGQVGPSSVTGAPSVHGLVDRLMRASAALGMHPDARARIDFTPVDYVARLIAVAVAQGRTRLSLHPMQRAGIDLRDIFAALERRGVERVGYATFWHALGEADDASRRLQTLLPEPAEVRADGETGTVSLAAVLSDASAAFATTSADRLARETGIVMPPSDASLDRFADACLRRAEEVGL